MKEELEAAELELRPDGSARLRTAAGVELEVDGRGEPSLCISSLHAIGVENLPDVASHTIVREADGTTHQLEFVDGGAATVSFDGRGKLREFRADGCGMSLQPGGVIVLKRFNVAH
jgi:hypothetical protein